MFRLRHFFLRGVTLTRSPLTCTRSIMSSASSEEIQMSTNFSFQPTLNNQKHLLNLQPLLMTQKEIAMYYFKAGWIF